MNSARNFLVVVAALGIAAAAQAGPAMFSATFIQDSFGNDITSGTQSPYNTLTWIGMPLGHDCQNASPYTPNGGPLYRYCTPAVILAGYPATGSGYLVTGGASVGAPVGLPQSAFSVDITGFIPTYYPYLQSNTYGNFWNAAGTFFAGNGAAAGQGTVTHSGMGQQSGQWTITEGDRGFGGVMGLLGAMGAKSFQYIVTGKVGTYTGTNKNWNMVTAVGRPESATVYSITPMGNTNWFNPHVLTNTHTNNLNGNTSGLQARATGAPWTTGSVVVYAKAGVFESILHRAGYDTVTGTGTARVRNIQLVTPSIVHWVGPGFQTHTAHVSILTLQITPEPGALLLLAGGAGMLALIYRASRRR
jgi:hypothetical protein